ncbi:hypothetical protein N9Y97_02305 [Pseudomonadales bacterium]|nr:hypothetical protein [Pseudomonadales bacterium]
MRSIITAALMLFCFFSSNSFAHDTGNCAQVESALERLDCYDGQAKLLSSLPTGDETVSSKVVSQPSAPSAPPESAPPESAPPESAQLVSKKPSFLSRPIGALVEYSATIAEIKKSQQKVFVVLSNEQIWRIQKSHLTSFKIGDKALIKQGMVGGFIMRIEGGGSYRVKQIQ